MYVHETENDSYAYDETITVLLTKDEAARLSALLFEHELSGGKPPGSTLYTALFEQGITPDVDAARRVKRRRAISIVSDQWERYWDTPAGEQHLWEFRQGLRWA